MENSFPPLFAAGALWLLRVVERPHNLPYLFHLRLHGDAVGSSHPSRGEDGVVDPSYSTALVDEEQAQSAATRSGNDGRAGGLWVAAPPCAGKVERETVLP